MSNITPNNMDDILVIGQGFLGAQIAAYFSSRAHVSTVDFPEVDLTNETTLKDVIEKIKPSIVINAAAFADTHAAEKPENHAKVFDINVRGPLNLLMLARQFKFRLVHIGTGMIYNGNKTFSEIDTPNPTSYYAWTKACADAILSPFCDPDSVLIARIHLPISSVASPKNLLTKMLKFDSFATDLCSFTVVDDFLDCMRQLLIKRQSGIFHIANQGTISFFEIAENLQKHGLIDRKTLTKTTIDQINDLIATKAGAPQTRTVFNLDKLARNGIVMQNTKKAVEQCIIEYKKNSIHDHK